MEHISRLKYHKSINVAGLDKSAVSYSVFDAACCCSKMALLCCSSVTCRCSSAAVL